MTEREFENQPVGVRDIDGPAMAVFKDVGVRRLDARRGNALLDGRLRLRVHRERDVMKRRCRHLRSEFFPVLGVLELEEGEGTAVGHAVEGMTIGAYLAEQLVRLAPGATFHAQIPTNPVPVSIADAIGKNTCRQHPNGIAVSLRPSRRTFLAT